MNAIARDKVKISPVESITYKGVKQQVRDVSIQWLSQAGQDDQGAPAYGLRLFTVGPGGEIPGHSHAYVQTMYILSGTFECWRLDPVTDEIVERTTVGPHDVIYVPSMEPHGMQNMSKTEAGTFLCCIGNVTDSDDRPGGCC
jgi:quercetin dioxygenase-like cupin family protein